MKTRWLPPLPASVSPAKPAVIDSDTGASTSHRELALSAARAAVWLADLGLQPADGIVFLLENRRELLELALAAQHAGLYYSAISTHMTLAEIDYVLRDCGAKLFITSTRMLDDCAKGVQAPEGMRGVLVDAMRPGWIDYRTALDGVADSELPLRWNALTKRPIGRDLLYSSGTTGKPKGIKRALLTRRPDGELEPQLEAWRARFGFDAQTIYLSPAPLYHAAPLRYTLRVLSLGGTAVVMPRFDAEQALTLIQRYRVTHSQWVPTMLSRMLQLPDEVRLRYDLSSMKVAIHAAAPCPVQLKRAMLDWWGEILHEYYGGSEGIGITVIGPAEWRAHPGSVGRPLGCGLHIVGENGQELECGEIGTVYFSGLPGASYLNDPQKTRSLYNDKGWGTYGDMGHIDSDGYLYLSDRRADLILSGGMNIYPQEIENALASHPDVEDVAVIGVPDPDFGEVPKAVVRLRYGTSGTEEQARALLSYCLANLGRNKLPRSVVFTDHIARLDNGKLLRRVMKERYRNDPSAGFAVRPQSSENS